MKISLRLVVCWVVALWVSIALAAPHRGPRSSSSSLKEHLKQMLHIVEKYNETLRKDVNVTYVDSARHFSQGPGRCGDKFFCLVYDIVHKHRNATRHGEHKALMRNLNNTINHENINCSIVMGNPRNTTVWRRMSEFLFDIKKCIQCRTLNLTSPSC